MNPNLRKCQKMSHSPILCQAKPGLHVVFQLWYSTRNAIFLNGMACLGGDVSRRPYHYLKSLQGAGYRWCNLMCILPTSSLAENRINADSIPDNNNASRPP